MCKLSCKGGHETIPDTAIEAPATGVSFKQGTIKAPKPVFLIKQDLDEKKNV